MIAFHPLAAIFPLVEGRDREPETGSVTVYRKHNKPALGPLGDSLEDLK
jgi:hypothetical protein